MIGPPSLAKLLVLLLLLPQYIGLIYQSQTLALLSIRLRSMYSVAALERSAANAALLREVPQSWEQGAR